MKFSERYAQSKKTNSGAASTGGSFSERYKKGLIGKKEPEATYSNVGAFRKAEREMEKQQIAASNMPAANTISTSISTNTNTNTNTGTASVGDFRKLEQAMAEQQKQSDKYKLFGQNIIPVKDTDNILAKIGKEVVNYGLGTINRIFDAPFQAIANASEALESVITGKPVEIGEKRFVRDILPDAAKKKIEDIKKSNPMLGGFIETTLEAAADPTTYIGGGIIDDLAKAGLVGKAAKPGTIENVISTGTRQANLLKKSAKGATKNVIDDVARKADDVVTKVDDVTDNVTRKVDDIVKSKTIDEQIAAQKRLIDDLEYQRLEYGIDTTKQIEAAENEIQRLQGQKYLPYYKEELDNLERIQQEILNDSGLTPEFFAMNDRVNRLKSRIADIEGKPIISIADNAVEDMPSLNKLPRSTSIEMPSIEAPVKPGDIADTSNVKAIVPEKPMSMEDRWLNLNSLGKEKKVNAYMFDNPELKPYFQDYAQYILDYEFVPNVKYNRDTQVMKKLRNETGLTPKEIKEALQRIVADQGQENVAAAKKIEVVIDEMLSKGFDSVIGEEIPPIQDYLNLKSKIEGIEYIPSKGLTVDDFPMPDTDKYYAKSVEQAKSTKAAQKANMISPEAPPKEVKSIDEVPQQLGKSPETAGERKFVEQYTKQYLPDNESELKQTIADIQKQLENTTDKTTQSRLNLQMFAANEKLKEVSKLKTNTLRKTPALSDTEIQKAIDAIDMEYGVKPHRQTIERAKAAAEIATDVSIERLRKNGLNSAEDTAEAYFISQKLANEAKQTGDYTKLKSFLKGIQNQATSKGQTIEAFKIWQQDPDGMFRNATKVIDDVENAIKKANPGKIKRIDDEAKRVKDIIDDVAKRSAKEAVNDILPAEMLAKRVEKVIEKEIPEIDPLKDMVDELFRIAKESPLPEKELYKRDPIEFLKQAIKNKDQYADIWEKAKTIVKEKYQNSPDALEVLEDYFNKGIVPSYSDKTLTASIKSGMTTLGQRVSEIVFKSAEDKQKALKELTDYLIKQTGATGDDAALLAQKVQDKFNSLMKDRSESILKNMMRPRSSKAQKTMTQRIDELINLGAFDKESIRDLVKEKYGLPSLSNADFEFISENIDKLKGLSENSREYKEILYRIQHRIQSKVPTTMVDKFRAWQRISMLLNPKTAGRNILGNVFMEKLENFNELTTEAFVDMIVSKIRGSKRTVLGPSALKAKTTGQLKGKVEGIKDIVTDIARGVDTYNVSGQFEVNRSASAFKNSVLAALEDITNKTLQFGDRPFFEAAKKRRLEELKIINKTSKITDEMELDAIAYALDRTFQNDSFLSGKVLQIKGDNARGTKSQLWSLITNIILPFAKTPANILDKLADHTPIGLMKAIGELGKSAAGKKVFNQQYFSQRLGRSLTGTGIIALGYTLAQKGIITGKPESSSTKKGAFDRNVGKQGYSLKTPSGYVSYDWAQPVGSLLAIGADAYTQGVKKADFIKGLEGAGNTFLNLSMLQNLNDILNYGNPTGGFIRTIAGVGQQLTPTIIKQVAKIGDEFERETMDADIAKETINKFMANIPGLRQTLPVKTDTFGKPVEVQEGYGPLQKIFNIAANPALVTKEKMTDYEKEMSRLYNVVGETDVLPSILSNKITYSVKENGQPVAKEYTLTSEEYNKYKEYYGDIAVNGLKNEKGIYITPGIDRLIKSENYKKLTDTQKAKSISRMLDAAAKIAKDKILKDLKKAGKLPG